LKNSRPLENLKVNPGSSPPHKRHLYKTLFIPWLINNVNCVSIYISIEDIILANYKLNTWAQYGGMNNQNVNLRHEKMADVSENVVDADDSVTLPKTNIGMAERKRYVERLFYINGKPPKKIREIPYPAPYIESLRGRLQLALLIICGKIIQHELSQS
jgi:hypothetical protein